jgi:hypothetical protein
MLTADFTIRCSRTAPQRIVKHWSAHSNVVLITGICWYLIVYSKDSRKNIAHSETAYTKHCALWNCLYKTLCTLKLLIQNTVHFETAYTKHCALWKCLYKTLCTLKLLIQNNVHSETAYTKHCALWNCLYKTLCTLKLLIQNIVHSETAYTKLSIHNSKVICPKSKFSGYCCWWFCNDSLLGCKIIEVAMRLFIAVGNGTKKNVNYRSCAAIQISSKSVQLDGSVWLEASNAT